MLNISVRETSREGSSLGEDWRLRNELRAVDEVVDIVAKDGHLCEGSLESVLNLLLVVDE